MDGRKREGTVREVAARLVMPEKPLRMNLLGDSVTHGRGGTGFAENQQSILGTSFRYTLEHFDE